MLRLGTIEEVHLGFDVRGMCGRRRSQREGPGDFVASSTLLGRQQHRRDKAGCQAVAFALSQEISTRLGVGMSGRLAPTVAFAWVAKRLNIELLLPSSESRAKYC